MLTTTRVSRWLAIVLCGGLVGIQGVSAQGGSATQAALSYVTKNHRELRLTGADVKELAVSSSVPSRHNGVTHVYLQQRYRGIDVFNGVLSVSVGADGRVIAVGNRAVANIASVASGEARKDAAEAAQRAAAHLNAAPGEASLVWAQTGDKLVRLAWRVSAEEAEALVDAETGAMLQVVDLVVHDNVEAIVAATARPRGSAPSALSSTAMAFDPTDGAAYNVFPLPFESPNDGDRVLVSNAADPTSSPFGWHDTDGASGPEFMVTRGNNVHAYTDVDANGIPDPGSDPAGGGALLFDFPLDLSQNPEHYRPAAVTNLFYWNNVMHDVTYRYGFDEAAGNFQVKNYDGSPGDGDDVRAEAQDGSGTNNANFLTPRQNAGNPRPRMQMFVWTHPLPNLVTVTSPAAIADDYAASRAIFGPQLNLAGVSGQVVLSNDGGGASPTDGCEPLIGFPAGSIALIDRGSCTFVVKVANAQAAGASGVIIANNVAGGPVTMSGVAPAITIPAVGITLGDGNLFKANTPLTATLRANPVTSINRDSDLDAGVIAHEYGHGISIRLTGGPNNVSCLPTMPFPSPAPPSEQMGEGWSDWFALVLTTHPSDRPGTARGIGPYLVFEPADGAGIRPTPYTTDMSVNASTYASVANPAISAPHGVGYVWNTMLWEMYWNLVDKHGYNPNVYGSWSTGGNNLAIQLVMDGMKIQPCEPGFVDGRDAILAADEALTGGANSCEIWRAFAKRGLGAGADQGDPLNRLDGTEAFDLPASCTAATFGGFRSPILEAPALNEVDAGDAVPVKFTLAGGTPSGIDSQPVDCTTLVPTGEAPQAISSPGNAGMKQKGDDFHVNWKTEAAWAGSCRRLTLRIAAASDAVAFFRFN